MISARRRRCTDKLHNLSKGRVVLASAYLENGKYETKSEIFEQNPDALTCMYKYK